MARPALLAFAAAAFLHLVIFRGGTFIYLFHKATTGVWVDEGARVAHGEVMYRDFFEVIGPGIVYLNAGLIRLFGPRLDVLAYAGLALGVALALALYALTARVAGLGGRLLAPALFVVLIYAPGRDLGSPAWPALLLVLAGLALLAAGGPSLPIACAAGLAMGTGALFHLELAAGAAAGTALHLLLEREPVRGAAAAFGLGCLAPVVLVMGGFAFAAGPSRVLSAWLTTPWRHRVAEFRIDLGHAWGARTAAWAALVLGGVASAVMFLRPGRPAPMRLVARAGLGLLLVPAAAHVDAYTLTIQSTVLLVCLVTALEGLGRSRRPAGRWAARAALAVLGIGLVHGGAGLVVWRQLLQSHTRQQFRAGAAWIGAPALELEWIERRTVPGDRLFVFPAGGMFFFLTHTWNATSFPSMVEGRVTADDQRRALAEIEEARPAVGVWLDAQRFSAARGAPGLDTLYEGILGRYEREAVLPNGTLLLRRKAVAEGRPESDPPGRASSRGR